jgi:hypothetical protein
MYFMNRYGMISSTFYYVLGTPEICSAADDAECFARMEVEIPVLDLDLARVS